jgi:hypothetical protein
MSLECRRYAVSKFLLSNFNILIPPRFHGECLRRGKAEGTWRAIQCKKHRLSYMTRSAVKSPFAYSHSFTLDISQRAIFTTFALRSNLIRKLLTFSRCSRVLQRERYCYWGPCSPRYQSQHNARERPSLCLRTSSS